MSNMASATIHLTGPTRWRGAGRLRLPAYPFPARSGQAPGATPTALPPRAGNNRLVEDLRPATPPRRKATAYVLSSNVNIGSRRGEWGNRVSPRPRPAGAWGNRVSPCPHPREGLGGLRPPKNKRMCIAALCAMRMTVSREHRPQGCGETGFPRPPTRWEGLGGRSPPKNNLIFIAALCGIAAWTAEVNIVRMVQPPSQPPPAGGRRRVPAPGGGGSGKGRSPCPRRRGAGGTPALPGHVHWGVVRHAHDRLT